MIAFIVNQFPRQVDAYFLRELTGLAEGGLDFAIYSLLPAPRGFEPHARARELLARTVYPPTPARVAAAATGAVLRRPARATAAVARIVRSHATAPLELAKSLAVVPSSFAFAADMQRRGVRHIHANWATYPTTAALVISRLTGIPYSFSGHASDIFLHRSMLREKIAGARFVVTCTGYNRGYLARLAPGSADRIRTVYHGVDLERFAENGRTREPGLVLSVGTLRRCKGYDDLIRAMAILAQRSVDARLEIIGDGEERAALEALVDELALRERVRLLGYLPQEAVIPAYQRASVVALPAHHEDHFGIPNILIEGLAAGAPVICTELPSLGELVEDGRSGLFVRERDPEGLAGAIERLLRDPAAARRLAAAGYQRVVERFDVRSTVDQLLTTFRAAAAGTP